MSDKTNPRLSLGKDDHFIEYVGGGQPYYWIGDSKGNYYGSVDAADLRRFVQAPRKSRFAETERASA